MKELFTAANTLLAFSLFCVVWLIAVNIRLRRQLIERTRMQDEVRHLHSLERAEKKVLALLARNAPLEEILRAVAKRVEKQVPDLRCAIALYHEPKRSLELVAAPVLGKESAEVYQVLLSNIRESELEDQLQSVGSLLAQRLNNTKLIRQSQKILQVKEAILVRDSRNQVIGLIYFFLPTILFHVVELDPELIGRAQSLTSVGINLKRSQDKIYALAHYDGLTDLPNRAFLQDYLQAAIARARRSTEKLAVCFLDLDGFKAVNDQHGHDIGDLVLAQTARRLSASIRESDMLARLGGDEFVVVLEQIHTPEDAALVANKILQTLRDPFPIGTDATAHLGSSIGIAVFPDDGLDYDTLIKHADVAMYAAKQQGSRYCYYSELSSDPV